MQYWSLAIKLESLVAQKEVNRLGLKLKIVFYAGLILQCSTGYMEILAFNSETSPHKKLIENSTDFMNIFPQFVSLMFLLDALRRLRKVTAGNFVIDTFQMILHISGFAGVVGTGTWLTITTHGVNTRENGIKRFYINLDCVVAMIFLAELPFLYIINRLVSQSLQAQKLNEEIKV